jgi:peptidoglycan hydrolase-like protein with peptidoglycan-binding domain
MNRLVLFVTAIGVSALAVYAVATSEDSDEEIAVATVTQRTAGPPPALVALPQPVKRAMPTDFPSLAREIQRELKRVGCYRGEVNGLWTPQTRTAMKAFVDDANAVLPVDKPDQVLLSLLQGERDTACSSCPVGQQQTQDGACVASTVATNSATITGSIDREESPPSETVRAAAPTTPTDPAPAPTAHAPESYDAEPAHEPSPQLETAALDDPASPSATEGDLVPPPAAYPAKPRRTARYPRNRPPKIVRSLVRSIKRGLAPLGF